MQKNKRTRIAHTALAILASFTSWWGSACTTTETLVTGCPNDMIRAASQPICLRGSCGNGVLDTQESCDDGNQIDGDGCSSDCRSNEVCGNAIIDQTVGEVCDDGNVDPDDQCCGDCRSCPELAVRPLSADSHRDVEQARADAMPCHTIPTAALSSGAAIVASLVPTVLAPSRSLPAPLLTMAPAPLLPAPPFADSIIEDMSVEDMSVTPAWLAAALEQARTIAKDAEKRLKSEKRKRRRLKEAQEHLTEDLQRAQQAVTQLEQINAELHQYVADECQQIENGRSKALQ